MGLLSDILREAFRQTDHFFARYYSSGLLGSDAITTDFLDDLGSRAVTLHKKHLFTRAEIEELAAALTASPCSISRLVVEACRFKASAARVLAHAIANSAALAELEIHGNGGLLKQGWLRLALRRNHHIATVRLCRARHDSADDAACSGDRAVRCLALALSGNATVTSVECKSIGVTDSGACSLAELRAAAVTSLDLSENAIGCKGAHRLLKALSATLVSTLDLSNNAIVVYGRFAGVDALKTNRTLTALNLGHNRLGAAGTRDLAEALALNASLTALNLADVGMGDEGAARLAEALNVNATLARLDVSGNSITELGACSLGDALKLNLRLARLGLSRNCVGDNGVWMLAEALRANHALTALDVSHNDIGDAGLCRVADVLADSECALTSLNVASNEIGNAGVQHLAEALKARAFSVDLTHNSLSTPGGRALVDALEANAAITAIDVSSNYPLDGRVQRRLESLAASNKRFQETRRALGTNLTRCWVRALRASDPREPLASLPRELVSHIVGSLAREIPAETFAELRFPTVFSDFSIGSRWSASMATGVRANLTPSLFEGIWSRESTPALRLWALRMAREPPETTPIDPLTLLDPAPVRRPAPEPAKARIVSKRGATEAPRAPRLWRKGHRQSHMRSKSLR